MPDLIQILENLYFLIQYHKNKYQNNQFVYTANQISHIEVYSVQIAIGQLNEGTIYRMKYVS